MKLLGDFLYWLWTGRRRLYWKVAKYKAVVLDKTRRIKLK